tara:strand:- start:662 stop:796 length:135 start_codon:yes stop_codon:yes gene_type:complete
MKSLVRLVAVTAWVVGGVLATLSLVLAFYAWYLVIEDLVMGWVL